jgi:membrane-bound lytic murein transglycosylase D
MLNLKLKTGSLLIVFILTVFSSNAGYISPIAENTNGDDTTETISTLSEVAFPEIPLHSSMENFVADYAESFEELFENLKVTKSNYFKTIDKIFQQHSIPVELKYLAIIESKLKTNARSGVGAVGVWQFMPATAKRFGLKITSKYDERQNLWKSTEAAAKYLDYLYGFLEDWLLVVASYNSGPGPVLNAIKKSGSRSFWKLQYFLPKETRLHVKRFIATHYYFEGKGSLVTLSKSETEKYLKAVE